MTTAYQTKLSPANIEGLPEFEGISRRFLKDFESFVQERKLKAVKSTLKQELGQCTIAENENLVEAVMANLEDEALLEKRYIFLTLNPQYLL